MSLLISSSIMQRSEEDLRHLERVRMLAASTREPRLPIHFGYDLALQGGLRPLSSIAHLPVHLPLHSSLAGPGLFSSYPSLATSPRLAASTSLLRQFVPPVLPLSVTRGLVQSSGRGLDYSSSGKLSNTSASSLNKNDQQPTKESTPTAEDLHAQYERENELTDDFKPGRNSVIIGRKKNCYTSVGNLRLRDICLLRLPAYSKCTKKKDKSEIVSDVVKIVRESCPKGGAFVKLNSKGTWSEVKDVVARERVASIFRDFLHDQYRSSSKSKVAKRREMRVVEILNSSTNKDDSCTTTKEDGEAEGTQSEASANESGGEESDKES